MDLNAEEAGRSSSHTRKLRWLQVLNDFNCAVTDDHGEYHTWRAWGSRVRKKQNDYYVMGPRDFQCTTWYLNKTRLRTWDHFLEVVKS